MNIRLLLAVCALSALGLTPTIVRSQERDTSARVTMMDAAYGARVGYAVIPHEGNGWAFAAFYDVPIGNGFLTPEIMLLGHSINSYAHNPTLDSLAKSQTSYPWDIQENIYGINIKIKAPLVQWGPRSGLYGSIGMQFLVWYDRLGMDLPIDLNYVTPLGDRVQLELTGNYTPIFFPGGEPGRGMFSIFAGVRLPVYLSQ